MTSENPKENCASRRYPFPEPKRRVGTKVPAAHAREREFMQRLRGRGWVEASQIPDAAITLKHLLEKRWVERQGHGVDASYRITEEASRRRSTNFDDFRSWHEADQAVALIKVCF
jgi:hypothetical protein